MLGSQGDLGRDRQHKPVICQPGSQFHFGTPCERTGRRRRLPLAIVPQFAERSEFMIWTTVPLSVVISWIFYTMEVVGDSSEDPFENFVNDAPLTALCCTIEIDLRQMLGETDVPAPIQPQNDILI